MKTLKILACAAVALLLTACGGDTTTAEDKAIADAATALAALQVDRVAVDVPHNAIEGWEALDRAVLDNLTVAANNPLATPAEGMPLDVYAYSVIEKATENFAEMPHATRYKQVVGTVKMNVPNSADSISAMWHVDIDWPDTSLDENRGIRHWINNLVCEVLNNQFPQPESKPGEEPKPAVKPFRQALDDPAAMILHYAGQYSRCYKSLMSEDYKRVEGFDSICGKLANAMIALRVRAISEDWVTYCVAIADANPNHQPAYYLATLNRHSGEPLQVSDITDKANVEALTAALQAACPLPTDNDKEKPQLVLGATPEGLSATQLLPGRCATVLLK